MMRPKEIRRQARITLTGNYFFAVNLNISLTIFTMALTIVLQSTSLGASPLMLNQVLFWVPCPTGDLYPDLSVPLRGLPGLVCACAVLLSPVTLKHRSGKYAY